MIEADSMMKSAKCNRDDKVSKSARSNREEVECTPYDKFAQLRGDSSVTYRYIQQDLGYFLNQDFESLNEHSQVLSLLPEKYHIYLVHCI